MFRKTNPSCANRQTLKALVEINFVSSNDYDVYSEI